LVFTFSSFSARTPVALNSPHACIIIPHLETPSVALAALRFHTTLSRSSDLCVRSIPKPELLQVRSAAGLSHREASQLTNHDILHLHRPVSPNWPLHAFGCDQQ
jgi:hypothetical protein